jgi:hypothetical protein
MSRSNDEKTFESTLYSSQEKKLALLNKQNEIESKKLNVLLKSLEHEKQIRLNICLLSESKFLRQVNRLQRKIDTIRSNQTNVISSEDQCHSTFTK